MDTTTLAPKVAAAAFSPAHADNRNLSFHEGHDVQLHSGAGVGTARVAQLILGQADIRECVPFLINRDNINRDNVI